MEPKPFDGWAVFREKGQIVWSSIAPTRQDAIDAFGSADTWIEAQKFGYRCLPVTVTPREVKP